MNTTIIERLREHAGIRPDTTAFRFIGDLDQAAQELSFRQLWQEASAVASSLSGMAEPGSRIMLFFPPGLAYIKAFYGCLLAGMVAVPLYPPRRNVKSDRIIKVAQSCQATIALTTESELAAVRAAWDEQNSAGLALTVHASDTLDAASGDGFSAPALDLDAPAFLQYTSGSTGLPKGVIITHANIGANVAHLSLMSTGNQSDVFVNWLPLFHDLGLVTAVLWPVALGATSILMAPATFVRDPAVWLKAITRYRGTMCGAPNFAYALCADKVAQADLAELDLSSWRVAYNAAEPVRADTLDRFCERFAACGFAAESLYPSYGMAEATVFISGGQSHARPITLTVDKRKLAAQTMEIIPHDHPQATRIVACGAALPPHAVAVVDPSTGVAVADGSVGEIWFSGPSVSPGYWQLPELSADTFNQPLPGAAIDSGYLRTGDLGLMHQGELYVTGRLKDLIILNGRNYYPQDIEVAAMQAHPAIRAGYVAAFAMPGQDSERLTVVAEVAREYFRTIDADEVSSAIRHSVLREHEVNVDQVVLLKPYKIPVTSSGKIQRRQTRQMLQDGELDVLAASAAAPAAGFIEPASATELFLRDVWCKVLGRERISAADNFFDIGGNSLAAAEMAAALRKRFAAIELDVTHLFDAPTIAELARWLDLSQAHSASTASNSTTAIRI